MGAEAGVTASETSSSPVDNSQELLARVDQAAIQASLSWPSHVRYHAVEDGELERIMKIEKPVYAGFASGAFGLFLGALPEATSTASAVNSGQTIDAKGLIYVAVTCCAATAAIVFLLAATRGKSEAVKALEAIRARPQIALPMGHPAAPPPRM